MADLEVKSEIYTEADYVLVSKSDNSARNLTNFYYNYPLVDEDGDLILKRKADSEKSVNYIEIEHSSSTVLKLVGLQIWRGALLLSDFLIHIGSQKLQNSIVLELGSGVGLTSIVASMFSSHVLCTDVNIGGILQLIDKNFKRNSRLVKSKFTVAEIDFFSEQWSAEVSKYMDQVNIVLAADVIYDNEITDGFIKTIERILRSPSHKEIYVALEKRFVFTMADLDSVAPCYEHFCLRLSEMLARGPTHWKAEQLDITFPKYFNYDRIKHLVLWKIYSEKKLDT